MKNFLRAKTFLTLAAIIFSPNIFAGMPSCPQKLQDATIINQLRHGAVSINVFVSGGASFATSQKTVQFLASKSAQAIPLCVPSTRNIIFMRKAPRVSEGRLTCYYQYDGIGEKINFELSTDAESN